MVEDRDDEAYRLARRRVKELRDFYIHVFVYVVVNVLLLVINLISSPDELWFYWATIAWGVGLGIHGMSVLFQGSLLGQDWEDRKIKKYMDKSQKKDGE